MTKEDANPQTAGMPVEARIFLGIGTFVVVITLIYLVVSNEASGLTMLALTAAMGLFVGAYLTRQARKHPDAAEPGSASGHAEAASEYLPEASIWPFWIGVGAFVGLAGLVLGFWALVPGGAILGGATMGYVRQGRRRD